MQWVIVTCSKSRHIVPAQIHLFMKYAPQADLYYADLGNESIETWGDNVVKRLPEDPFIVFGLDDYLPIDNTNLGAFINAFQTLILHDYDRFELGYGASKKVGFIDHGDHLEYGPETPYSVSCQFSIWKTSSLRRILSQSTTPWDFEVNHKCKAACFSYPVFRWIEESALSKRHPGKINVLGLRPADLEELINRGMIDREKIQYGMPKGPVQPFDVNNVGEKYRQFYE